MERLLSTSFLKKANLVAILVGGLFGAAVLLLEVGEWRARVNDGLARDEAIKEDVEVVKADVEVLKEDVEVVKADVEVLKEDVEVVKADVEAVKEDVEVVKADVEAVKEDVEVVKADIEAVKEDVEVLKTDVRLIGLKIDTLTTAFKSFTETTFGTVATASPSKLTEFGRKISREAGGAELAKALAVELAPRVEGMIPYDIQELSFEFIYERVREDPGLRRRVRNVGFDNGVGEFAVVGILSIELRDVLLEHAGQ